MIVDPWGDVLVEADEKQGIFSCTVNLERISECRKNLPALEDIRLL